MKMILCFASLFFALPTFAESQNEQANKDMIAAVQNSADFKKLLAAQGLKSDDFKFSVRENHISTGQYSVDAVSTKKACKGTLVVRWANGKAEMMSVEQAFGCGNAPAAKQPSSGRG